MTVTLEARRALCAGRVTLNGVPAVVTGARNPFAVVATLRAPHVEAEYSWAAVERVIARGGTFRS
jgi:hypothetical protein